MTPFNISTVYDNDSSLVIVQDDVLAALRSLPLSSFKLIITSPPYNIGKEYETQTRLEEYLNWQTDVIMELHRITSDDGSIVWQVGNYVHDGDILPLDCVFYPLFNRLGMRLRNRIIWHFGHGLHSRQRFSGRYETLLWFTKTDQYIFNLDPVRVPQKYPDKLAYKGPNKGKPSCHPLGKNPSDFWSFAAEEWQGAVWEIPNVKSNHPEKENHPCQFPVELAERCVLALTNLGDWVLDPFGGTGSSVIAAVKNDRCGMMIDREHRYIEIARNRIARLEAGRLPLRSIGKNL